MTGRFEVYSESVLLCLLPSNNYNTKMVEYSLISFIYLLAAENS